MCNYITSSFSRIAHAQPLSRIFPPQLRKELIGPEIEDPVLPLADPSEIMGRRLFGDSLGADATASDRCSAAAWREKLHVIFASQLVWVTRDYRFYSPGYASFTSSSSTGQRGCEP